MKTGVSVEAATMWIATIRKRQNLVIGVLKLGGIFFLTNMYCSFRRGVDDEKILVNFDEENYFI